jgi:H+/Cl- antiporter ClcA
MKIAKGILWIALFVLAIVLVYQNEETLLTGVGFQANLTVFNVSQSMSVWVVILISFFLGVVAMAFFSLMEYYHMKRDITAIKRAIKEKDKELNSLRNLPLTSNELPGYKEEVK